MFATFFVMLSDFFIKGLNAPVDVNELGRIDCKLAELIFFFFIVNFCSPMGLLLFSSSKVTDKFETDDEADDIEENDDEDE